MSISPGLHRSKSLPYYPAFLEEDNPQVAIYNGLLDQFPEVGRLIKKINNTIHFNDEATALIAGLLLSPASGDKWWSALFGSLRTVTPVESRYRVLDLDRGVLRIEVKLPDTHIYK